MPIVKSDEAAIAEIRSLRDASNAMIVARDAEGFRRYIAPDYKVIYDKGSLVAGADAIIAGFAEHYANPAFVSYKRHTTSVEINGDGTLAAEHGHWEGLWRDPHPKWEGTYLAMWRLYDGRWLMEAELYVLLREVEAAS